MLLWHVLHTAGNAALTLLVQKLCCTVKLAPEGLSFTLQDICSV
jgi:hypothetical protein